MSRARMLSLYDQENVQTPVGMTMDSRTHETVPPNPPKGPSASAGDIERASCEFNTTNPHFEDQVQAVLRRSSGYNVITSSGARRCHSM